MKSFKVMCSIVVLCVVVLSATAKSTEEQVKDEVQDIPKKSSSDAILNAEVIASDVKKLTDVEITTIKSVIIDALIKTADSTASATVSTLTVETTTEEDEEDDDEYGQPEVDNGLSGSCIASLCGGK